MLLLLKVFGSRCPTDACCLSAQTLVATEWSQPVSSASSSLCLFPLACLPQVIITVRKTSSPQHKLQADTNMDEAATKSRRARGWESFIFTKVYLETLFLKYPIPTLISHCNSDGNNICVPSHCTELRHRLGCIYSNRCRIPTSPLSGLCGYSFFHLQFSAQLCSVSRCWWSHRGCEMKLKSFLVGPNQLWGAVSPLQPLKAFQWGAP